jgi:hypothetical protein
MTGQWQASERYRDAVSSAEISASRDHNVHPELAPFLVLATRALWTSTCNQLERMEGTPVMDDRRERLLAELAAIEEWARKFGARDDCDRRSARRQRRSEIIATLDCELRRNPERCQDCENNGMLLTNNGGIGHAIPLRRTKHVNLTRLWDHHRASAKAANSGKRETQHSRTDDQM